MDRRRYLAALVSVPVVGVAGCSGDGESPAAETDTASATDSPTETATDTVMATDSPTPTDTAPTTETPTPTGTATDTGATATATDSPTATATDTPTPVSSQTVEVAPGSFRFNPESFEIAVGGTVEWVWEGNSHNIVVDSQPAGSEWEGTSGGAGTLYDEGHVHEYTFDVAGSYEYYCAPHEDFGMRGSFEVV